MVLQSFALNVIIASVTCNISGDYYPIVERITDVTRVDRSTRRLCNQHEAAEN